MKFPSSILVKPILFCLGLFLLFALIYKAGFSEIAKAVSGAKLETAAFGVLAYLAVIALRSFKWFLLAKSVRVGINYKIFAPLYMANSLFGNITPLKLGEAATPFLFKKYLKIPIGQGFSIIILDRFFELAVYAIILVSAVFYLLNQEIKSGLVLLVLRLALSAFFLLLGAIAIVIVSKKTTLKIAGFFRVARFIEKELDGFYGALSFFKDKGIYQTLALLTLAGWLFEIAAYYLVFSSVLPAPFMNIASAHIVSGVATLIAFVPAGIGVTEVSVVSVLSLFQYPLASAAAGAILADVLLTGSLFIFGLLGSLLIRKEECSAELEQGNS